MADGDKNWTIPRRRQVRLGARVIETEGLSAQAWTDVYHGAMRASWLTFFAGTLSVFLALNLMFATLYAFGDKPVANATPGSLFDLFFFSVETLATVGYGDMHPQSLYGHLVATVEIFTGMSMIAVMTGLVFARISRPQARFLFARKLVVGRHDGKPSLMIRLANARVNTISGANARLWLLSNETSREGRNYRCFRELALERSENPIFSLSWTLFHVIEGASPLVGANARTLEDLDALLLLTVSGYDEQSTQELKARIAYSHTDIAWQHRYLDMVTLGEGRTRIDFSKIHDVVPD